MADEPVTTADMSAPAVPAAEAFPFLRVSALLLAALIAALVFVKAPGSAVALAYAVPLAALGILHDRDGWTAGFTAIFCLAGLAVAAILIEPGLINMLTGIAFLIAVALVARGVAPQDGLGLARHGVRNLIRSPLVLVTDAWRAHPQKLAEGRAPELGAILVPVVTIVVFGKLLTSANPLLASQTFSFSSLVGAVFSLASIIAFILTLIVAWSILRKGAAVSEVPAPAATWASHAAYFGPASVAFTLAALNLMFLAENSLDIFYIWFDRSLPAGLSHADYVHRGAYTLIFTAILSAVFVMVALRPGSTTNASPLVRWLVYGFAAQNVLLVMSSVMRTLSYVEAYGLTELRLAGLVWMALVAASLVLTVWRIASDRDNRWLINSNISAAALLLLTCGFADSRGFIANWNVDRAIAANAPESFDLNYNAYCLGGTALPAIERFRMAFTPPLLSDRPPVSLLTEVQTAERSLRTQLKFAQGDWRSWTLRYAWLETSPAEFPWYEEVVDGCAVSTEAW